MFMYNHLLGCCTISLCNVIAVSNSTNKPRIWKSMKTRHLSFPSFTYCLEQLRKQTIFLLNLLFIRLWYGLGTATLVFFISSHSLGMRVNVYIDNDVWDETETETETEKSKAKRRKGERNNIECYLLPLFILSKAIGWLNNLCTIRSSDAWMVVRSFVSSEYIFFFLYFYSFTNSFLFIFIIARIFFFFFF